MERMEKDCAHGRGVQLVRRGAGLNQASPKKLCPQTIWSRRRVVVGGCRGVKAWGGGTCGGPRGLPSNNEGFFGFPPGRMVMDMGRSDGMTPVPLTLMAPRYGA